MRATRILILGMVLAAVLGTAGCGRKRSQPKPPPPPQPKAAFTPKMEVRGVTWTLPDEQGRPLWELEAARGATATAQGLAEMEDVRCKVYEEGKASLDAVAPRVKADYAAKRLVLFGGVDARATDGKRSFRSEQVTLSTKEQKRAVVEASGGVRLTVDGTEMVGERLVTNPQLDEGQLLTE